ASPNMLSFPSPPLTLSSPASALIRSLPPLPNSESLLGVPSIVSSPGPPMDVKKNAISRALSLCWDACESHSLARDPARDTLCAAGAPIDRFRFGFAKASRRQPQRRSSPALARPYPYRATADLAWTGRHSGLDWTIMAYEFTVA